MLKIIIVSLFFSGCSLVSSKVNYSKSDHFDGNTFYNPWGNNASKGLWDVLKWKISSSASKWPDNEIINSYRPNLVSEGKSASVHVTFIGQATTYIQDAKMSILTDPQFSNRASPISFLGPKRIRKPALQIAEIPTLDFVLISHNHYDHLDLPTIVALDKKFHPTFIVPLGNKILLEEAGLNKVIELDWWESFENIQLVPASHWSARGIYDRNKTLWGGFVINIDNKKVFFAGDTAYGPHFKMIHDKLGAMDISIIPIGAYAPRWFMKSQHIDPEEAVKAHMDLASKQSFAIHFETFQLTDEAFSEPRNLLLQEIEKAKINSNTFFIPEVGQTLVVR
jgi:L-ascorbate metabolism protein UlaG (beta-lactamase superfamily)